MSRETLVSGVQALLFILICQAAGLIGAFFTGDAEGYYELLDRPPLAPPASVFAPVWINLYVLIGIAAFIIWRRGAQTPGPNRALAAFGIQLGLNALWTPIFFGLENPGGAAIVIIALWLAIVATIVLFLPLSRLAALLMAPYLLWVTYAAYLNIGIWWLNR